MSKYEPSECESHKYKSNKYGISAKDVYDKLYTRIENDNILFWNRLPFYITIFGFCATGYGYTVSKLFNFDDKNPALFINININIACLIIALIGFVVALFWVIIAKGSRYWFERNFETVYHYERPGEHKIVYGEKTEDLTPNEKKFAKKIFEENDKYIPYNFFMLKDIPNSKESKNIFDCKAGLYSMGKAQILLGQLIMCLWGIIFIIHGVILLHTLIPTFLENKELKYLLASTFTIIGSIIVFGVLSCEKLWEKKVCCITIAIAITSIAIYISADSILQRYIGAIFIGVSILYLIIQFITDRVKTDGETVYSKTYNKLK